MLALSYTDKNKQKSYITQVKLDYNGADVDDRRQVDSLLTSGFRTIELDEPVVDFSHQNADFYILHKNMQVSVPHLCYLSQLLWGQVQVCTSAWQFESSF